ncbi:hypothetical protein LSM04_007237 [Trypanosoma melophagium]|uniref:uncharacterized protein n=1 Tax=Trypanosoma melophagium TaxID=715481 RepID=UPI00351A827A|nr:hypothetical protein LSM04_007237 [Trypanosoma melophagium]
MAKAIMLRCYLLCLLTLALCCASGLVWADSPKASDALIKISTVGAPSLVRHAIPAAEGEKAKAKRKNEVEDDWDDEDEDYNDEDEDLLWNDAFWDEKDDDDEEGDWGDEIVGNKDVKAEHNNDEDEAFDDDDDDDDVQPQKVSGNTKPSGTSGQVASRDQRTKAQRGSNTNSLSPNTPSGKKSTPATTTATTTTLPSDTEYDKKPNVKGDADSSSSISSMRSVWVRVPLLIVVTLACILLV